MQINLLRANVCVQISAAITDSLLQDQWFRRLKTQHKVVSVYEIEAVRKIIKIRKML